MIPCHKSPSPQIIIGRLKSYFASENASKTEIRKVCLPIKELLSNGGFDMKRDRRGFGVKLFFRQNFSNLQKVLMHENNRKLLKC